MWAVLSKASVYLFGSNIWWLVTLCCQKLRQAILILFSVGNSICTDYEQLKVMSADSSSVVIFSKPGRMSGEFMS